MHGTKLSGNPRGLENEILLLVLGYTVNDIVCRKVVYMEIYRWSVTEFKPPTELP